MDSFPERMSERFMGFIVGIMKLEKQLYKTYSGRHIYGQLFRSGTSSGANFEEARAAESKADFVHKMQIVLKELRESHFWVKLIISAKLIHSEDEILKILNDESKELSNITAKSIVTAKAKIKKHEI
ncbi:MAG: four helix bundle protein [Bacteroidales bacterium]|nr:four helix bundle protein [Bacteroidales bacterium]